MLKKLLKLFKLKKCFICDKYKFLTLIKNFTDDLKNTTYKKIICEDCNLNIGKQRD